MKIKHMLLFTTLVILLSHCSKINIPILSGKIIFITGSVLINNKKAVYGNKVSKNDKIITHKRSTIIIQFNNDALIALKENTKISINKLAMKNGKPNIKIFQKSGLSFNKIIKKKAVYKIYTPTTTAGVRGTSFTVSVNKKRTTKIKLLHGKVEVTMSQRGKEVALLSNNQEISINKAGSTPINTLKIKDRQILKTLDLIPFQNKNMKTKKEITLPKKVKNILIGYRIIKKNLKKPHRTLTQIKKNYGRLSLVITKKGTTFKGFFKQKGLFVEIVTTKGKVRIPSEDIKIVKPL